MSTDLLELDHTGSRKVEMFVVRYFGGLEAGTCVQISAPTEDCGWGYVQINKKDWEVLRPVLDQAFGFNDAPGLTPQELERFANLVEAQQSDRYKALAGELAEAAGLAESALSFIYGGEPLDPSGAIAAMRAALAKYKQEQEKGV
jgi:hypothetical protein